MVRRLARACAGILNAMSESKAQAYARRYGVRSALAHLAMCTATAVMLTLAFPKPGWSFMAFVALVPVGVLAMRTERLWTLGWTSYLVFVAWWVLRSLWLKDVSYFAPFAVAVVCGGYFTVALVGLAAVQRRFRGAMTLTLPVFWCAQEYARCNWPLGGFAWFTLGSSQAAWREGQSPGYLVQSADLFGWITVSFLVAMTSGLLVDLIARPLSKRLSTGVLRPRRTVVSAALLWMVCFAGALIYGQQRVAQAPSVDDADARTVSLGIVQTNVPQDNKSQSEALELLRAKLKDFDIMLDLSGASARENPRPDVIVWPETMMTLPINDEQVSFLHEVLREQIRQQLVQQSIEQGQPASAINEKLVETYFWQELERVCTLYRFALTDLDAGASDEQKQAHARALDELMDQAGLYSTLFYRDAVEAHVRAVGVPVVVGSQSRGFSGHDRTMNSALLVEPGEAAFVRYSKMHRVPLGEYIPGPQWLRELFLKYISPYEQDYTVEPGEGIVIFEVQSRSASALAGGGSAGPIRFATPICYEDAIASQCRKMVYATDGSKRADLLLNLTNDGWYPGTHQGYQHLQIAVMRCIENRVPMARSVNTGVSGVIDSSGRVGPLVGVAGQQQEVQGHVNAVVALDSRSTLYGRVREGFALGLCGLALLLLIGVFVPGGSKRRGESA